MSTSNDPIIEVDGVRKSFGGTEALAGIDLTAETGRVLALLGPNGAGKTTLVRILATLLTPDAGKVRVAGYDAVRQPAAVRSVIGLTGQHSAVDDLLTGRETTPRMALRDIATIARRNLRRVVRTPQLLVVSAVPPVLFVVLFRYVFGGAIHTSGGNYADYLLPTVLILTQLLGATTAVALATDLAGGMVDRFRSLPIARSAMLAGRTIADLGRGALVVLAGLVAGLAVGFRFHTGFLPSLAGMGLVLAFSFAMSWEMSWVALKVKDPETAQVAGFLPLVPLVFASSGFVPVASMPGWLQGFAKAQPISVTISAVRALTQGGPTAHYLWQSAAWIAGILVVFGALAVMEYRKV